MSTTHNLALAREKAQLAKSNAREALLAGKISRVEHDRICRGADRVLEHEHPTVRGSIKKAMTRMTDEDEGDE